MKISKILVYASVLLIGAIVLSGCISEPKGDEEFEFLAMEAGGGSSKSSDEPRKVEVKERTTSLKEGRVQEYRKSSKIAVINIGSSTHGIKNGISGKLYSDAAKTRQIGIVDLTNVHSTFSEGTVRNMTFEINLKEMDVLAVFEVEE